jgi:site-specific recombinase XerD
MTRTVGACASAETRDAYRTDLAVFFRWLHEREIEPLAVQRPDLDRFLNWLIEPIDETGKASRAGRPQYASSTAARRLASIRSFYAYGVDRRVLGASPASGVKSRASTGIHRAAR